MSVVAGLGFNTDLETIMKTFSDKGTVRYEEFSEIWRKMKMNKICAGRQSDREAREFMEVIFDRTVPYWLPPFTFQSRVCALYILYGLYCTQPCKPLVKIRLTLNQWLEILNFMKTVADDHHLDVSFIFHKLRAMKAFHFVGTRTENYYRRFDGDADLESVTTKSTGMEENAVREVVNENTLQQLEEIQSQYYNVKCALAGPGSTQPERSLNILNQEFVPKVKEILSKFEETRYNSMVRATRAQQGSTTDASDPDFEVPVETVGSKRKKIRARAYGLRSPAKSPRYKETANSQSSESDSPKRQKRKTRKGKKATKKINRILHEEQSSERDSSDLVQVALPGNDGSREEGEIVLLNMPMLMPQETGNLTSVMASDDVDIPELKSRKKRLSDEITSTSAQNQDSASKKKRFPGRKKTPADKTEAVVTPKKKSPTKKKTPAKKTVEKTAKDTKQRKAKPNSSKRNSKNKKKT